MIEISVIVPVYNAEKTLERCLDSLAKQNFKKYEVLLINDGSSDKSLDICNLYTKKYPFIKIINKINEGVSKARNLGVKYSRGNIICFVDSDDYVEKNMLSEIFNAFKKYNTNFLMYVFNSNQMDNRFKENFVVKDRYEALEDIINNNLFKGYVWNKAFKKNIIQKYNISFNENIHMCEDLIFCLEYLSNCNNAVEIYKPLYNYVINKNSISNQVFNKKQLTIINAYSYIENLKFIKSNDKILEMMKIKKITHSLILFKDCLFNYHEKDKKSILEKLKKDIMDPQIPNLYKKIKTKYLLLYIIIKLLNF